MTRRNARGLTLLEVMVAVAILAMVAVLTYGAFDGLSRGKKNLGRVNDRYHQGRAALSRMTMRSVGEPLATVVAFTPCHSASIDSMTALITPMPAIGSSPPRC